jgi:two-component system, cell cycle response regulator
MAIGSIRTLLIEDNPADARIIQEVLSESPETAFDLEWVDGLGKGLKELSAGLVDLVLLDLHLPESCGLDTFNAARACAPTVPIVVLTGLDDRELALKLVRNGAQDYLVKGQIDNPALLRSMQYALVRQRLQHEEESPAWRDSLTDLYNRQGFLVLGEQLLLLADKYRHQVTLYHVDLVDLETVNELYGRESGDRALQMVADALCETVRESEIGARVGGHQFAFMGYRLVASPERQVQQRFVDALRANFRRGQCPYLLNVNWGISVYDPAIPTALSSLMRRAEAQACSAFPWQGNRGV